MKKTLFVTLSLAFASSVWSLSPVLSVAFAAEDAPASASAPEKAMKKKPDAKTNAKKKPSEPPAKKDPKMVNATFKTNMGDIKIAFNKEKAPKSVEQFETLIKEGFYKGIIFHRVIPGFMIQAGGFEATLAEKTKMANGSAVPKIVSEAGNGLKNKRGTIALARTNDPNSASSQFFINLVDNGFLDKGPGNDGYTVIGEVTAGMDVVDKIAALRVDKSANMKLGPVFSDLTTPPAIIETATID